MNRKQGLGWNMKGELGGGGVKNMNQKGAMVERRTINM